MGVHARRGQRSWLLGVLSAPGVWPVAVILAVCVAAVVGVTIIASTVGLAAPEPAASAVPAPRDPTSTPQAKVFLAETYMQGVGPDVLDAKAAVFVATAVCEQHEQRVGLASLSVNVRAMFPRLSPIQAHTLVDDAIKYYCGKW